MKVKELGKDYYMITKIKKLINETFVVLYSLLIGNKNTPKNETDEKIILIPYANIFGDIVLFLDCIDEFNRIFPVSEGYKVVFVCRPAIKKFLQTIYPQCDLYIETVDWTRFTREYKYFLEVIKKYNDNYEKVIVPYDHTVTNDIFVRCINAKEKITQDYEIPHNRHALSYILGKGIYTKMITVDKNISVLKRQRVLINELGDISFESRIPYIPKLDCKELELPDYYAVICPTASYLPKSWPIDRFAQVADYIYETFNCPICICGGNENPGIFEQLNSKVNESTVLIDMIAKTNFAQWTELMRGARLAVCNDSASYHLSAAVRTASICIAGDFACVNAPNYDPDIVSDLDKIPVVLYNKMSCEGCRYIGYQYGYGNSSCKKEIKERSLLKCVDEISTDRVIDSINTLNNKYELFK